MTHIRFYRDILAELASVGDLPLPKAELPPVNNKRERQAEPESVASTSHSSPSSSGGISDDKTRSIAGNRRVSSKQFNSANLTTMPAATQQPPLAAPQSQHQVQPSTDPAQQLFALPMYTDELGRLPLHGQVSFASQAPHAPPIASANPDYWYPPATADQVQQQHQLPNGSANNNTMSQYSMIHDPLYDQLGASYPSSYTHPASTGHGGYRGGDPRSMTMSDPSRQAFQATPRPLTEQAIIDNDTMAMWSSAPTGFECVPFYALLVLLLIYNAHRLEDWGTYLTNVSELAHGLHVNNGDQAGTGGNR